MRKNPTDMLPEDVLAYVTAFAEDEKKAVKEYGKFINRIHGLPGLDDLRKLAARIYRSEVTHYNELEKWRKRLEKFVYGNS